MGLRDAVAESGLALLVIGLGVLVSGCAQQTISRPLKNPIFEA